MKVADIRKKFTGDLSTSKEFNQTYTGISGLFPNSKMPSDEIRDCQASSSEQLNTNNSDNPYSRRVRSNHNPRFCVPLPIRRISGGKKENPAKKEDISGMNGSDKSSEDSTFREYVLTTGGNITPNVELETLHKSNLAID